MHKIEIFRRVNCGKLRSVIYVRFIDPVHYAAQIILGIMSVSQITWFVLQLSLFTWKSIKLGRSEDVEENVLCYSFHAFSVQAYSVFRPDQKKKIVNDFQGFFSEVSTTFTSTKYAVLLLFLVFVFYWQRSFVAL